MIFNGREVLFPSVSKISFYKIYESLEQQCKDSDPNVAAFAKNLLKEVEPYPMLREGFSDFSLLEKYKEPIAKLSRVLFPEALLTNEIKALTPPFNFESFYNSTRFKSIHDQSIDGFSFAPKGFTEDLLYVFGCSAILGSYYHFPVESGVPMVVEIPYKDSSITHTYRIAFNADMIEMFPTEKAIEITHEDYIELIDNFTDIDLWKKKFPPNSWIMRGIGIANLMDVTIDQALSQITSDLLVKSNDTFEKVQNSLKVIFNNKDLIAGFTMYENDTFQTSEKDGMPSLMLGNNETLKCHESMCDASYKLIVEKKHPMAISNIEKYVEQSECQFSKVLQAQGIQSYLIAPLINNDEFLGFLELGSKNKYDLTPASLKKLEEVLPIISMASSRFRIEFSNTIEAVIQQECTTIHPAVKWRFVKEAKTYLEAQEKGEHPRFDDIVFKKVYPLYGQLDLKGSSDKRNEAVQADLMTQMSAVKKVLVQAYKQKRMPIYEELIHRTDLHRKEIKKGLLAGSENKILGFVKAEINPLFAHLKKSGPIFAKLVEDYNSLLDPVLNLVYDLRKNFDESVGLTNQTLATFLDEKQIEAQEMFPHYFERYKTDGVEFNIYIGQSISQNETYDPVFTRNLRLWQLIVMCEMENKFNSLQKSLATPLEVASLILAYSAPLSIHFRMDEKRFDVEGAYNARYEIVKKRVDKAHIKGTNERITEPGKIAIIYSNEQDAREYREYINFLQAKGYLKNLAIEDYELEDLQGITGLRALRVELSYFEPTQKNGDITMDQIMEAIEKS